MKKNPNVPKCRFNRHSWWMTSEDQLLCQFSCLNCGEKVLAIDLGYGEMGKHISFGNASTPSKSWKNEK